MCPNNSYNTLFKEMLISRWWLEPTARTNRHGTAENNAMMGWESTRELSVGVDLGLAMRKSLLVHTWEN